VHQRLKQLDAGPLTITDCLGTAHFNAAAESDPPAAKIVVQDLGIYRKTVKAGSLGFGDSYVDGDWSSTDLPAVLETLANVSVEQSVGRSPSRFALSAWQRLQQRLKRNSIRGSRKNIASHYDLSNRLFELFLDPTFTYSCGIFENEESTLEDASNAKYERICRKLELSADDRVLEIGCGWGGFVEYAVKNYGCHVTAVTISQEQLLYAKQRIAAAEIADRVDLRFCDYRDLTGEYDKLVSIEMIEAVGHDYLPTFVEQCDKLLKPGGKILLQGITIPAERYEGYRRRIDFIQKYIFPGGCLVSLERLRQIVAKKTTLNEIEEQDFSSHYRRMLLAWRERFLNSREQIAALRPDEKFFRAWDYYFAYCAAGFAVGKIGVSQILYESKPAKNGAS
ncbi:MAG: cyclopropane-fatty-acyl-phospholipid synthase family protein, partial [Lacipirellulaceae bacterium]